ncbi:DNA-directed RNA polymerase III subunit RPC4 [Entomophthora muscae]|uniref:DNA-directed RNA polymerase III subunit RPC4 n=1 Tax=Entomophthora muscae TaxID=34485 RepID=A0ACC2S9D8_9FUNG|nr:DNA-directed RNA polymerase III subunit RPC4 [Entomophthora muscae]
MDPNDITIKTEPSVEKVAKASSESASAKPALTKGGAKKRSFAPKATVRQARPAATKEEPEKNESSRDERNRRGRPDRGRFTGPGRGRGREERVSQASGPFSMGPAGLGSQFKKAQPMFSGLGGGHGGGGGGGGSGGSGSHFGQGSNIKCEIEEEDREEYEDAELMVHVEGGEELKIEGDGVSTKEEVFAAELTRQLNGLDLHEDKMSAFVDSFDVGKKEDIPNKNQPLLFFQLPATLPHLTIKGFPSSGDAEDVMEVKSEDEPSEPQSGRIGKLIFYKSGKVQMRFGQLLFDINTASNITFHQEVVALDSQNEEAYVLGDLQRRFVCTPNIDSLLKT